MDWNRSRTKDRKEAQPKTKKEEETGAGTGILGGTEMEGREEAEEGEGMGWNRGKGRDRWNNEEYTQKRNEK